jgi:hypothetical protein
MKRFTFAVAVLGLAAGCQDGTSPPAGPADDPSGSHEIDTSAPASLTAPSLWAVVNANGTLARGSRVISINHFAGTGQYEVTFNRSVSACAYVSTTRNAFSQAIQSYPNGGHLSANGVFVEIKNQGGGLMDGPFNLVVTCGTQQKIRFAVVGYTSNLVRATTGTTLSNPGPGRYFVTFPTSVHGCAYIASVGDPGNGLALAPSGVYTGSGPTFNSVYIETKNPGGGLQSGVPFHLAIICNSILSPRFAVVRAAGSAARHSLNTSSALVSTGNYRVTSNRNLSTCAAVATRGSVNTGVPFNPATVEITPGANTSSFGIQVRTLLFFGGALTNQAFHAAAVC